MKKILSLLLILSCVAATYSQTSNHDIDKIVSDHLKEFRNTVGQDAKVIIAFDYDAKSAILNKNDFVLEPIINSKKIKGNDTFFVRFLIINSGDHIAIRAINFKVIKVSRKHLELVNMDNGREYQL
jgi:hypothetical protein